MHKAGNGDCISIITDTEYILIDGGTAQSYDTWKTQIFEKTDKIDALVITHIDNDHVNGIIKLLEDPACPEIKEVLFNGAEQLLGKLDETSEIDRNTERKLKSIIAENLEVRDKDKVGYSEGTSLSFFLNQKLLKCNNIIDNEAISIEKINEIKIGTTVFSIISPSQKDLISLKKEWESKLRDRKINLKILNKTSYLAFESYLNKLNNSSNKKQYISSKKINNIEALAKSNFEPDHSPTNRSSFSFLIINNNKKILYLGDCHAESILTWLNKNNIEKITVDAVKISHHGSKHNTSLDLLSRVNCSNYLISTNGKVHNHPDLETLARIIFYNKDKNTKIYINYELNNIPYWFLEELNNEYENIKLYMNIEEVEI
ncbi:MBL fold metallo-hydrolase [Acinetobacter baumannii]|nr:MBL fold metallo-hydrolase [Acinetobacter baumannii]MCE6434680.1 MBL fold metallo-hydrolase [Acinetobacter baumannii]MCE6823882.1 MBL fold metallo-hydrolase [Acinetobacter baumannii]MCE6827688.1 MBL fold metallo-hydrolase [Acinetobacter baumannii]MCE6850227.1 MBL fold metallo-hydrolase [Acinetobacter baumannii]MCZ0627324.1 MBL fold metallo-hydrolase [Acinetobacter baumannii]